MTAGQVDGIMLYRRSGSHGGSSEWVMMGHLNNVSQGDGDGGGGGGGEYDSIIIIIPKRLSLMVMYTINPLIHGKQNCALSFLFNCYDLIILLLTSIQTRGNKPNCEEEQLSRAAIMAFVI